MIDLFFADQGVFASAAIRAVCLGFTLLAAGTALVNTLWLDVDAMKAAGSARTAASTSLIAFVAVLVAWVDTARQLYGDAGSAFDPQVVQSALSTPPGQFYALALAGLAWIFVMAFGARTLPYLATPGAIVAILSVGLVGHTLDEPRVLLYTLLTIHLFLVALWIGALVPLSRLTRIPRNRGYATDLAEDLGRWGFAILPGIVLAAGYLGWLLMGKPTELLTHDYARLLQIKVLLFLALAATGALNRFIIVPRLRESLAAGTWLRATIVLEAILFAAMLFTVATATVSSHPMHAAS